MTDPEIVSFYLPRDRPYGCFSNFSNHGFELDGRWWPTAEHCFQAQKFTDQELIERVRQAATPGDAKKIGADRHLPLRPDWEAVKDDAMRRIVRKKFETHADLRALLLSTGEKSIVENSPHDSYWGTGQDGRGRNMLGRILMETREALRQSTHG